VAGVVLATVAGGLGVAQVVRAADACNPGPPRLEVVASPDIAATVARVAQALHDPDGCSTVRVRAEAGPDVLAALRQKSQRRPDVWIPDSSLWVERARAGHGVDPVERQSIASTPLVLAVSRRLGTQLPHTDAVQEWQDVTRMLGAGQVELHAGPAASSSTAGLLVALKAEADQQPDPRAALAGMLSSVRLDAVPGDGGHALATLGSSAAAAVPVTEQAVFQHNGDPQIAVVHPRAPGTPFDYPFAILSAKGSPGSTTADHLLTALRDPRGQELLRADGFRGVDGTGAGLPPDRQVQGTQPGTVAVPSLATVDDLLKALGAVQQDARVLAVVDVSGSMASQVPGSNGSSRLDVALRAAAAGLELYPSTTEVGLWSFSLDVSGTTDYRELVPIAPLDAVAPGGRQALALAMTRMRPLPDGGTGLYDTTLAAVRAVRADWDPARVNAVVLLTDGDDTDPDGIGLDQLLSTLRSEQAGKPIPVIAITFGSGAGAGARALAAISAATGGAFYQATDSSRIRDIFLDALGQRACRPDCSPGTGN
jgi:hypothetical protein